MSSSQIPLPFVGHPALELHPEVSVAHVSGAGNEFALVDLGSLAGDALTSAAIAAPERWCRLGSEEGGDHAVDGVLVVARATDSGAARMVVVNRDGTRPEMCGNGLRCVAAHLARVTGTRSFVVATDAGERRCDVRRLDEREALVSVELGRVARLGSLEAAAAPGRDFARLSVGNPHAVTFVEAGASLDALALELGPGVERDPAFAPGRTNVGFARLDPDGTLHLAVWERGVGLTRACGTGAAAAAVAAVAARRLPADTECRVRLAGGDLGVFVPSDPRAPVVLTGPATVLAATRRSRSAR